MEGVAQHNLTIKSTVRKWKKHSHFYSTIVWAVTRVLGGGGRGVYSYICVLTDEFLLKSVVIRVDFKRNSSRKTRIFDITRNFRHGRLHFMNKLTVHVIMVPQKLL